MMKSQFLKPSDVAKELGLSSTTIMRRIHAGEIPAIRLSDRIYRIPRSGFELYKSELLRQVQAVPLGGRKSEPRIERG